MASLIAWALADADGNWSVPVSVGEGSHTLRALAEDVAGLPSNAFSNTVSLTVDTQGEPAPNAPPIVSSFGLSASEDDGSISAQFVGNDPNADALTYSIASQPTEGSVINNLDGTFTFDPG